MISLILNSRNYNTGYVSILNLIDSTSVIWQDSIIYRAAPSSEPHHLAFLRVAHNWAKTKTVCEKTQFHSVIKCIDDTIVAFKHCRV